MKRSLYLLVTNKGSFQINGFDVGRGLAKIKIGEVRSLVRTLECSSYHLMTQDGREMICLNEDLQTVWMERA